MPTISTVPLCLLLVLLWFKTGGRILPAVLFVSVFDSASALQFGGVGVFCWLFTLLVFGIGTVLRGHQAFRIPYNINRAGLFSVLAFASYAAISDVAFPILFGGTLVFRTGGLEPLEWNQSNFAQLFYLCAVVVVFLLAVSSKRKDLEDALDWYMRGCVTAAIVAVYQLANAITHIPYPDAVLYSNPSYVIYRAYKINGLWRLNGPFTEASDMAGAMVVGLALVGWKLITEPVRISRLIAAGLMVFALLMTQSSTGYVTLILMLVIGTALSLRQAIQSGGLSRGRFAAGVLVIGGAVGMVLFSGSVMNTVEKVVQSSLLEKQNSESYRMRTGTHVSALQALQDTDYIGTGWGTVRASGLYYVLLANTGIIGTVLFFTALASIYLPSLRRRRSGGHQNDVDSSLLLRSLFGITTLLATMFVAGSELGDPVLWAMFGAAVVAGARQTAPTDAPAEDRSYALA